MSKLPVALIALAGTLHAQPPRVTKDAPARRAPAKTPAKAAPAKAAPAPLDATADALKSLADADRAFSARSERAGLRDAALATLADDAVLFQPRAVRGRAWLASSAPVAGKVTWAPAWTAVSAGGDMGVTTGPFAFRADAPVDTITNGQYVTAWTRVGKDWKASVQLSVPGPVTTNVAYAEHRAAGDGRPRGGPGAIEASRATLYIAERGLAAAARADGSAAAFSRLALPDTRVLRGGVLPLVGPDAIKGGLADIDTKLGGQLRWQVDDLRLARSGDFGVAYGVWERHDAADAITEQGNYVRVWERQADGGWRLLLDAMAPLGR